MKVKFIHLNIWDNGHIFPKALKFLLKQKPDIVNLQEVYDGHDLRKRFGTRTLQILRERLGLDYFYFSPSFNTNREGGRILEGNVIFSRWPIMHAETTYCILAFDNNYALKHKYLPLQPKNLQLARVEVKGKIINVFNTHGVWGTSGEDTPNRLKLSKLILSRVKGKKNVILSGDFNVNEGTESINMIGRKLKDVFKGERISSFNMRRKPKESGYATAVVDFVFASKNIKVLKHSMPDVDVSDHYPLVCEFEI